jgi:hypothetical protein
MTLDEFFAVLETTPRDWNIRYGDVKIRRNMGTFLRQCPIIAVAAFCERGGSSWMYRDAIRWKDAARALGLQAKDARKIVNAADGHGRLRQRLLAACKVGEG